MRGLLTLVGIVVLIPVGCSKGKTNAECAADDWCKSHGHCTAKGDTCVAGSDDDCQASKVCANNGKCVMKDGECIADEAIKTLKTLPKEKRLEFAKLIGGNLDIPIDPAFVRMRGSASNDAEFDEMVSMFAAHRAAALTKKGSSPSEFAITAELLERSTIPHIKTLEPTEMRRAKKDSAANLGKVLEVSGVIHSIRRKGNVFRGLIMTEDADLVHFYTAGNTENLFAQSKATFVGICIGDFVGQVAIAGHFKGQGMD